MKPPKGRRSRKRPAALFVTEASLALRQMIERRRRAAIGRAIATEYEGTPQTAAEVGWADSATVANDLRGALVTHPRQGEIWWAEAEDKRRPVVVVTLSRRDRLGVARRTACTSGRGTCPPRRGWRR